MIKRFPILGYCILTIFVLVPQANAQEAYKAPEGVTILTEAELLERIIGNTARGKADGTRWTEYYLDNGTIKGMWGSDRYGGKWKVSGPVMCYDYSGDDDDGCWTLSLNGDSISYYNLEGKKDGKPTTLYQGNSEGL